MLIDNSFAIEECDEHFLDPWKIFSGFLAWKHRVLPHKTSVFRKLSDNVFWMTDSCWFWVISQSVCNKFSTNLCFVENLVVMWWMIQTVSLVTFKVCFIVLRKALRSFLTKPHGYFLDHFRCPIWNWSYLTFIIFQRLSIFQNVFMPLENTSPR